MTPPTILRALGTHQLSCGESVAVEKAQLQVIDIQASSYTQL